MELLNQNKMKQTAVEWLYNKMLYIDNEYDMKLITKSEYQFKRRDIIEQAKEMEKEQKGFSEDDVNLAFMLGKKDDHVRLHKLINSKLGELKSE